MRQAYLVFLLLICFQVNAFERETFYSDKICVEELHGQVTTLPSGLKPDCETAFAVIEFDWAKSPKHYECIGQALIYAWQTTKIPVCLLMARNPKEWEFAQSLTLFFQSTRIYYIPWKLF